MIEAMNIHIRPCSRFLSAALLVGTVLIPAAASAQSPSTQGHFVLYVAPIQTASTNAGLPGRPELTPNARLVHVGGGGEGFVTHHLGIGTDIGGIAHATNAGTLTVFSLNAFYHANVADHRRLDPFLTAGVSGFFYDANHKTARPNAGAGINLHVTSTVGLTLEYRQLGVPVREVRLGITIWQ